VGQQAAQPGEYVALLAPAYAAIKAACPSMWVVSGALTPAGNNGNLAMDDFTYLEAMMQAGASTIWTVWALIPAATMYPPQYTWEGRVRPSRSPAIAFNGACDSPHHSWSFRSTMEGLSQHC
jgi:hypothetical protein